MLRFLKPNDFYEKQVNMVRKLFNLKISNINTCNEKIISSLNIPVTSKEGTMVHVPGTRVSLPIYFLLQL
jgi:hypothetical protein